MSNSDLRRAWKAQQAQKQDVTNAIPALMGNGHGVVQVPSQPGYVYIRLGQGDLGQAYNNRCPLTDNLAIYVGYDPVLDPDRRIFQVLSVRMADYAGAGGTPTPNVPPHHLTHEYGGGDDVYVSWRRLMGFRVGRPSGFQVTVDEGVIIRAGAWLSVLAQTIDLTALKPVGNLGCYVLIVLNAAGVVTATAGASVAIGTLDISDCPIPGASEIPLAAVRLYGAQTAIGDVPTAPDIIDLRFPQSTSTGDVHLEDLSDYARGHIIRGGAADWESYDVKADKYFLVGDGTDIVSRQIQAADLPGTGGGMTNPMTAIGDIIYEESAPSLTDNLAVDDLGASATASSTFSMVYTPPEYVLSSHATYDLWENLYWTSNTTFGPITLQWIYVDLGAEQIISKWRLKQDASLQLKASQYIVAGSHNAIAWTDIVTHDVVADDETVNFSAPQTYRYFRVWCTATNYPDPAQASWRIYHFFLYGAGTSGMAPAARHIGSLNEVLTVVSSGGNLVPDWASGQSLMGWFNVVDYGATGDGLTDDTTSIQDTIDAAEAAGGGIVYFPRGVYIVNGALQDGARGNAQLLIPDIDTTGKQISITLLGQSEPAVVPSLTGAITLPDGGSIIKGTLNAGVGGALLGGWGPVGSFGDFTLVNLRIENLSFQMPDNPVLTALNLSHIESTELINVVCNTGNYRVSTITEPSTATSYGVKMPNNSNGAWSFVRELLVVGFYNGIQINEHTNADNISFFACKYAAVFLAAGHSTYIGRILVVWCENGLKFTGANHTQINLLNIEHYNATPSKWFDPIYDIDDASNYGLGYAAYHATISGTGVDDPLVINGGTNLHIRKLEDGIGAESLATTTVVAGAYTNTDLTVDAYGRITAAANGAAGAVALDDLSDVDIAGSGTGDILYNNAGTWEDYPLGVGTTITKTSGKLRFGSFPGSNYLEIDTTSGNLRLVGDATAWDDILVAASVVKPGATAPAYKAFGPSGGLFALMFEAGHHDEAHFEVQLPHRWKEGSKIYPHVHWTPTTADAGNVVWELEYSWANIDGTFGAPSNMASDATAAGGTAWVHKLTMLKEAGNAYIDGTGKTISSMLVCRLHRNSNAGSDTLNKDVALMDVDFHYEIDSFGSDEEYVKDARRLLLLETSDYLLLETGDKLIEE